MVYIFAALLLLINTVWLTLVLFALPGNWLMVVGAVLFAWFMPGVFSVYTLILITVLAVIGEVFEFLGGYAGARKRGASFLSSMSAIVGAIGGAIVGTFLLPLPVLGTILGACAGAGGLSALTEIFGGKSSVSAVRTGIGAGFGQFIGIASKFIVGCLIWISIAAAAFWP